MKRSEIRSIFPEATDEQVSKMLTAVHSETDELRDELDKAKEDADKAKKANETDGYKEKYEKVKKDFEDYKAEQEKAAAESAKKDALKELIADTFSENGVAKVLKYTDLAGIELTKDGKVKDAANVLKNISEEWSDFVVENHAEGANTSGKDGAGNIGGGAGGTKKTREEIMAMTDTIARQQAIAENHELFGF